MTEKIGDFFCNVNPCKIGGFRIFIKLFSLFSLSKLGNKQLLITFGVFNH